MLRKEKIGILAFIAIIIFYCYTYYNQQVFRLPSGVHDWAQSDRYALAVGFYDNGMDFFKPRTLTQFSIDGITGVEFPIQAYLAAALAHIFGRDSLSICFRLIDILMLCTGLTFLFFTCYQATRNFFFSLIPPLFMFCSPVLVDYAGNYLPDPFAASLVFVAFYHVYNYIETNQQRFFYRAIILFTLATLIKTSLIIYTAGFMLMTVSPRIFFWRRFSSRDNIKMILSCVLSVVILGGYYFYNQYLNNKYQSGLFLSIARPFKSWEDFIRWLNEDLKNKLHHFFILPLHTLFFAIAVPGIVSLFRNPKGKRHLMLILIFLVFMLIVMWLLGEQLFIHDYYYISIFFPLIVYILVVSAIYISNSIPGDISKRYINISIVAALLICFFHADSAVYQRLRLDKPIYGDHRYGMSWMVNGIGLLDELHIPKSEKIFVPNQPQPNLALVYFDRKGFTLEKDGMHGWDIVAFMEGQNLRTLVIEDEYIKKLQAEDSNALHRFTLVGYKAPVMVYQLKEKK